MKLKTLLKISITLYVLLNITLLKAEEINKNAVPYAKTVESFINNIYTDLPKTKNDQEIHKYFEVAIPKYFAIEYISSWTLGRYAKQLNPDMKADYSKALLNYIASSYGNIFKNYYKSYNYKILGATKKSETEYDVNVNFVETSASSTPPLNTQWRVRYSPKTQQYYIVDIIFQNISFLNSQRTTFEGQVKKYKDDVNAFVTDFIKSQK